MREGLCCVLSVKVPEPKFSSQTKDKLVSSEVRAGGRHRGQALTENLGETRTTPRSSSARSSRPRAPRGCAQGARDDAPQGRARRHGLPGKLADRQEKIRRCARSTSSRATAGGSAKQGARPQVPGDPSCCAARSSTSRRRATRSCSPATKSSRSSPPGHRHRQNQRRRESGNGSAPTTSTSTSCATTASSS